MYAAAGMAWSCRCKRDDQHEARNSAPVIVKNFVTRSLRADNEGDHPCSASLFREVKSLCQNIVMKLRASAELHRDGCENTSMLFEACARAFSGINRLVCKPKARVRVRCSMHSNTLEESGVRYHHCTQPADPKKHATL